LWFILRRLHLDAVSVHHVLESCFHQ
jgi:hypothetical protein